MLEAREAPVAAGALPPHSCPQRLLDERVRGAVHVGGGLVQRQDACVLQQCPAQQTQTRLTRAH